MATQGTPGASSEAVSRRMRNTPRRDTPVELRVRKLLRASELCFDVDRPVAGVTRARPDLVFFAERVAVFLDGCFWHSCPEHGTTPRANRRWWVEKLEANVERDRRHGEELRSGGWLVLRFWEHEAPEGVAEEIERRVRGRRSLAERPEEGGRE